MSVFRTLLAAVVVVAALAGCSTLDTETENRASVLENGVFGDLRARGSRPVRDDRQGLIPVDTSVGASQIFGPQGDGGADGGAAAFAEPGAAGPAEPGAYRLNFENAEIKDVVHAVLGEALKENYTLTPDVAGTITISSARPVGRTELLSVLETTLAAQGFSMVKSGGVYKIGATVNGAGVVDRGIRTQPGYGVSIVPLRFVSVRTMGRLLGGFVIDSEGVRIDSTSNTMVIAGPGSKRQDVVNTILSFDEDWMQDQTVGIFELRRANPTTVVPELERVFDAAGAGSGVITFKPITRLKAVMVVSRNASLVRRAETWVQRLDKESLSAGQQMYVYRARNRDAKELARIASGLFAGGSLAAADAAPARDPAAGDGFSIGADEAQDGVDGEEPPIDDVTGAGEDGGGGDTAPPDVLDLTTASQSSRGGLKITADPSNNSVIIFGDPQDHRKVVAALQQLDVPPTQVAINVTIAEVQLNDDLKYGVEYFIKSGSVGLDKNDGSISFKEVAGELRKQIPGFNLLIGSNSDPDIIVSALDSITDVQILSSPSLMVLENQKATLQVGDQIPLTTRQQQATEADARIINEIEYRDTGIILNVTPRVSQDGTVTMVIEQEISSVANRQTATPTISKRRVASNIAVNDGQTVVLAGLISTSQAKSRSGLPILSRIAGLGEATGKTANNTVRNELIVLIRPQIVRNGEDAQSVAEDLRSRMWAIGERERRSP